MTHNKNMTTTTTVKFTREFTKGLLKGLKHEDEITFVSRKRAEAWLKGIDTNTKLNYVIQQYSIVSK